MSRFVDALGREWTLKLTVGDLTRVREDTGVDLGSLMRSDSAFLDFLFGDPVRLVEVLWLLVKDQATGIDAKSFAQGFDGTTLEKATEAVIDMVALFFPRQAVAQAIRKNLAGMLAEMDSTMIQSLNPSNRSPGSLPVSSASTQDPSPSDSSPGPQGAD